MRYCFDLDGCLCSVVPTVDYSRARPFKKRIAVVNKLYKDGHIIIINTGRGSVSGINWESFTKKQLKKWGVKYHRLIIGIKPHADYYIDDRGLSDKDFFK